jgi:hypothetical protein
MYQYHNIAITSYMFLVRIGNAVIARMQTRFPTATVDWDPVHAMNRWVILQTSPQHKQQCRNEPDTPTSIISSATSSHISTISQIPSRPSTHCASLPNEIQTSVSISEVVPDSDTDIQNANITQPFAESGMDYGDDDDTSQADSVTRSQMVEALLQAGNF